MINLNARSTKKTHSHEKKISHTAHLKLTNPFQPGWEFSHQNHRYPLFNLLTALLVCFPSSLQYLHIVETDMTSVRTGRSTKRLSWFLCVFSVGAALGYRKQNSYIFTSNHEGMCFNIHAYTCICVLNHILSISTCHSTLYKFYTIQITSLFPCLITYHTEKISFQTQYEIMLIKDRQAEWI